MPISPEQAVLVRRLLAEGLHVREVARVTGISRDTIRMYANPRYAPGRPGPKPHDSLPRLRSLATPELNGERCPTCGGLVVMPCVLCAARQHHPRIAEQRAINAGATPDTMRSVHNAGCRKSPGRANSP